MRDRRRRRVGAALVPFLLLTAGLVAIAPLARAADPAPTPVAAEALPTWQVNGVVWSSAIVGNTVYVTGSFTKARPPGVPVGDPSEVAAGNIFAFDLTTGNRVASFNHSLDAQGLVVRGSPDGSRIYVGGDFATVDGVARGHVAAFNTADGSLVSSWAPNVGGQVRGFGITGDTVYVGGNFPSANGQARQSLAAFGTTGSAIKPWAPTAQGTGGYVWTMTMAPDNSRVIVGGSFITLSGVDAYGMGAIAAAADEAAPSILPWAATQRIRDAGLNGAITSLKTDGNQVFGSGYSFGSGATFEGTFAADPSTGAINWVNDCLGDTYDTSPLGSALYSVSHSHDCTAINDFPDTSPRSRWMKALASPLTPTGTITNKDAYGWDYRGLPYAGRLQWYPDLEFGNVTPARQAAWTVAGSGNYLVLAGEFPMVNGVAQQGLTRFAYRGVAGPSRKPLFSAATTPTATSTQAGEVRLRWQSTWDRDDKTLTYDVYRDNGPSIATLTQDSVFWNLPAMGFRDTGRTPGAVHTYKVRVKDSDGNVQWSTASAPVTVSSAATAGYTQAVRADGASHLWRLGDTGPAITDSAQFGDGTSSGATFGAAGAVPGDPAVSSAGGSTPKAYTSATEAHPSGGVSVEGWINTTSTNGGRIVGFGNSMSGTSAAATNDLVLYVNKNGKASFALNNGGWRSVASARSVNDGQWHHLAATADPSGISLFVDGRRVARDQAPVTSMSTFNGYWRILADQTSGLPVAPSVQALAGSVDEVAVYPTALSLGQVQSHYLATGRAPTWTATAPADPYGAAVAADRPDAYWRLAEPSGPTAADSSPNGQEGAASAGVAFNSAGALTGNSAATFNGLTGAVIDKESWTNPTAYSAEMWFKTTSILGGKLIGFGNAASGLSSSYDRQVCLLNNGRLQFGTNTAVRNLAESTTAYNDGQWHHLVATQGSEGMKLYVDAALAASNPATGAQNYTGYWRVGGDRCWGGQTSNYVAGTLDEVAVYPTALSTPAIEAHYAASGRLLPNKLPTASFTDTATHLALSVDGSGSSDPDGTIASYAWNFGDQTSGTGATPSHTYQAAGTYNVTLTVTDDRGGTNSVTHPVTVTTQPANQPPTASFTSTATHLALSVDGSGSSDPDGTIASYAWDFGDGGTGSGPTASHTYASSGTYQVSLTVTDDRGGTATSSGAVTVTANQVPTAAFTVSTNNLAVSVDGSGSTDPDGSIASYAWTFGDGASATGPTAAHAYADSGSYPITLTVTDNVGATTTATQQVTVSGPPNQLPTAAFSSTASFLSGSFDASGSTDPDGTITSYAWDFGDTTSGTGRTVNHPYAGAGTYPVTLTVTDDRGGTASRTASLTVAPNPAYATDTFARTVAGGWGAADLGGAWSVTGTPSRWSVTGGMGRASLAAGTGGTASLPSVAKSDTEVSTTVSVDKAPTGGGQYAAVIGRQIDAATDYRAKIRIGANGAVALWLMRTEGGVETAISSVTVPGLTYSAPEKLQMRVQVTGTAPTTLRAKVWKQGEAEPAAWALSTTDNSAALQTVGAVGIYSFLSGSATNGPVAFVYDDVWVGPQRP